MKILVVNPNSTASMTDKIVERAQGRKRRDDDRRGDRQAPAPAKHPGAIMTRRCRSWV